MKLKLLLSFLIVSQFIFCQINQKKETSILNKTEFKISYTSDLKLDESGKNGLIFLLLTEKSDSEDNFAENINLIKQDLDKLNLNLDKYVEITEKQITEKGKLIESKRLKKYGLEYQRLVYEAFLNNFDLKFLQYDFVKNNKAYILTFSAKKEEFDKYLKSMEEIMKSFKLK
jgi:serine/threonine-protein kinase